jgi:hypothetical protein
MFRFRSIKIPNYNLTTLARSKYNVIYAMYYFITLSVMFPPLDQYYMQYSLTLRKASSVLMSITGNDVYTSVDKCTVT